MSARVSDSIQCFILTYRRHFSSSMMILYRNRCLWPHLSRCTERLLVVIWGRFSRCCLCFDSCEAQVPNFGRIPSSEMTTNKKLMENWRSPVIQQIPYMFDDCPLSKGFQDCPCQAPKVDQSKALGWSCRSWISRITFKQFQELQRPACSLRRSYELPESLSDFVKRRNKASIEDELLCTLESPFLMTATQAKLF